MACPDYDAQLNLLEDYLEGTLSAAETERVRAHLTVCVSCREDVEVARAGGELLRGVFAPTGEPAALVAGTFWFRVRAGIRASLAGRRGPIDFWNSLELLARRLAWTAALVVTLVGGYATVTRQVVQDAERTEVRDIFPEPTQQPSSQEEVLLTLAENGR
jgi:anti-sigma factor RsiW